LFQELSDHYFLLNFHHSKEPIGVRTSPDTAEFFASNFVTL
jgi:hypothetical protein